jgi:hypothetical protein
MRRPVALRSAAVLVVIGGLALGACTTTTTNDSSGGGADAANLLHDRGAAAKAIAAIEKKVDASPAQVTDINVYPEYLDLDAQDPKNAEHIDDYTWRDGTVDPPTPVQLSGPQEDTDAKLFSTSAVHWSEVPAMVRRAEQAAAHNRPLRIEQPEAQYLNVTRSTSSEDDGRVVIRISVDGPRRSGYVDLTATGEIRSVDVN